MPSTLQKRLIATSVGYCLDRRIGEPPNSMHPLRSFGSLMAACEKRLYQDNRRQGIYYASCGTGIGLLSGTVISSTALATYLACGGRALIDAAKNVGDELESGDLEGARVATGRIVGRETDQLSEGELSRAAIETVAENTVDAVIAPMISAVIGGAAGVLGYRAVNTLDALVGYRNSKYSNFGWASARLDDVLNYIPARIAALFVIVVRPRRARDVWRAVRRDARKNPSPNAGVIESAFAGALGLRLGGENTYAGVTELRASLGDGDAPEPRDIARANRLSRDVGDAVAISMVASSIALMWWRSLRRHSNVGSAR